MPIVVEKGRLNLFNGIGMVAIVMTNVAAASAVYVNLTRDVKDVSGDITEVRQAQVERASITDKNFERQGKQIELITDLQYGQKQQAMELQELKESIAATNVRVDKFIELINAKLDDIGGKVNDIRIDVGVISGRDYPNKRAVR